jgi:hypothetical protein
MRKEASSKSPKKSPALYEAFTAHADPLCVRFNTGDLARITQAATGDGLARSVWIREIALARANLVLGKTVLKPLVLDPTKRGPGEQICIRFRPADWLLIVRASHKEGCVPSPWIRALVMQRVVGGEHGSKNGGSTEKRGNGSGNDDPQRLGEQDGPASPVPVVGVPRRKAAARADRRSQAT